MFFFLKGFLETHLHLRDPWIVLKITQKHHTLPADVLPSASEDLFTPPPPPSPPPPPTPIDNFNAFFICIVEINAYFLSLISMQIKCIDFRDNNNCLFLTLKLEAFFTLVLLMVSIVKSNLLFLEDIYCVFSNKVEFGSMVFDFEHLPGIFVHLGGFGSLGVDS